MQPSGLPTAGKIDKRYMAQDVILSRLAGIGTVWEECLTDDERRTLGPAGIAEFCGILSAQVDRIARYFGYEAQPFIG